jgi:hypothetical protein
VLDDRGISQENLFPLQSRLAAAGMASTRDRKADDSKRRRHADGFPARGQVSCGKPDFSRAEIRIPGRIDSGTKRLANQVFNAVARP